MLIIITRNCLQYHLGVENSQLMFSLKFFSYNYSLKTSLIIKLIFINWKINLYRFTSIIVNENNFVTRDEIAKDI